MKSAVKSFLPSFPSGKVRVLFIFGFLLFYFFINFVSVWWASRSSYTGEASAAIVLGAAQYNGRPSAVLESRLTAAGELYLDDRVELVVVTGGGQENDITTEAFAGYDFLSQGRFSIPDADLKLEVQGGSTYESLAASAKIVKDAGFEDVILVTDPYHAKRAQLVAGEVGLDAEVVLSSDNAGSWRLVRESLVTSVGRVISFRRVEKLG